MLLLSLLLGCVHRAPTAILAVQAPPVLVALEAAFDRHDADGLALLVTEDFQWLSVEGDQIRVDTEGREALRTGMVDYFASFPDVTTDFEYGISGSTYVSVRERVRWTTKDGAAKTQSAVAVYELQDGKIRRVWYYPSDL